MAYLPPEAALWRVMDPETAAWSTTLMVADLVAGVLDSFREDPIPRPWNKPSPDDDEWELTGDTFNSYEEAVAYFNERAGR
jgi:hypothetical protein